MFPKLKLLTISAPRVKFEQKKSMNIRWHMMAQTSTNRKLSFLNRSLKLNFNIGYKYSKFRLIGIRIKGIFLVNGDFLGKTNFLCSKSLRLKGTKKCPSPLNGDFLEQFLDLFY